jgi:hypothetical protein
MPNKKQKYQDHPLVTQWRDEAEGFIRLSQDPGLSGSDERVRLIAVAQTLRLCARQLRASEAMRQAGEEFGRTGKVT